jgi:hypothetical protein
MADCTAKGTGAGIIFLVIALAQKARGRRVALGKAVIGAAAGPHAPTTTAAATTATATPPLSATSSAACPAAFTTA